MTPEIRQATSGGLALIRLAGKPSLSLRHYVPTKWVKRQVKAKQQNTLFGLVLGLVIKIAAESSHNKFALCIVLNLLLLFSDQHDGVL